MLHMAATVQFSSSCGLSQTGRKSITEQKSQFRSWSYSFKANASRLYENGSASSNVIRVSKRISRRTKHSQLQVSSVKSNGKKIVNNLESTQVKLPNDTTSSPLKPKPAQKIEEPAESVLEIVSSEKRVQTLATTTSSNGLIRTPLSGGVLSATDSHDLPSPALAVRNLVEQVRYAHLCTIMSRMHHRRNGYPFGSMVDYATDPNGFPIFSLSPLAIHTRNLIANPRSSIVVQMPGWTGLSNARVTIFGDVYPLEGEQNQKAARDIFRSKHTSATHSHQWGNFTFFRMEEISDIYFVGGFGTVQWVDVKEYASTTPDNIVIRDGDGRCPEITLQKLNIMFSKQLCQTLEKEGMEVEDIQFVSIDKQGVDVRLRLEGGVQHQIIRLRFQKIVETIDDAILEMKIITTDGLIL